MDKKIKEQIEDFMVCLNADSYHKGKSWNGYDVYVPDYKRFVCIGLPYVVLVKGKKVRISSADESLDYLNDTTSIEED